MRSSLRVEVSTYISLHGNRYPMKHVWLSSGVLLFIYLMLEIARPAEAQDVRIAWSDVQPPKIISVQPSEEDPTRLILSFELDLGIQGSDRANIYMTDASGTVLESKLVGRNSRPIKNVEFKPSKSGSYFFYVVASKLGETETKRSPDYAYIFRMPLFTPSLIPLNEGRGSLLLRWNAVPEADAYQVLIQELSSDSKTTRELIPVSPLLPAQGDSIEYKITNLQIGKRYGFSLSIFRENERVNTKLVIKTIKDVQEREWQFTWFGQSTKAELNTFQLLDSDNLSFRLNSCSFNPNTGQIEQKGGKFTAFHDGVSFYYTILDPKRDNFELTATFDIDYFNPLPDGQEGFGLLVMDSLGMKGVNSINHYTNSAGIIATKFEEIFDGVKKTSKDTLGARFVTGFTKEIIASGDSGIAQNGISVSKAFSYDSSDLIKTGDSFRITLKKTNTGYHAIYKKPYATEDDRIEFVLYGPEKLQVLDPDHIYVGFCVARGCNVTVRDVDFNVTDVSTDPSGLPEPPDVVPLVARVESPTTYTDRNYPFVFYSNADGKLTVKDKFGKLLLSQISIKSSQDYTTTLPLVRGSNDFLLEFTPDRSFRPGPKQVIGRYDTETRSYKENYGPYFINLSVLYHTYNGEELYVSPQGSPFGRGTKDAPLDLTTAIYFIQPGQTIVLAGGVYYPAQSIIVERGNDGNKNKYKTLKSAAGERAILDFSRSRAQSAAFSLWGCYWIFEGLDIRNTPGDVKGLQIGGHNNIIRKLNTYWCGDTGLQISGVSSDLKEKWPSNNLVESCLSYDNQDPASNNADGFAAKLTVGPGNIFRYCISHHNIDDGWDLFSKIETGPISPVVIENCVAYMNGFRSDGSGNGDGNGFKMGGDGIAVPHLLRNSIAYGNGASGITSNSNPALIVEHCTSCANKGANVNLYGKGDGKRFFVVHHLLSYGGDLGDVYREMPELANHTNYFWNGAVSVNSECQQIKSDMFISTNINFTPSFHPDGHIDMKGLFILSPIVSKNIGAYFE